MPRGRELLHELEQRQRMTDVERSGRLVEQQKRSLAREQPRQQHALKLATAERADVAIAEPLRSHAREGSQHLVVIELARPAERGEMRSSTEHHQLARAHAPLQLGPLR
jgi:hypothetical protein